MNWFTLLKQPKLRVGNKVTTNLGSKSESQDDNCERKVREYADKVLNHRPTSTSYFRGYSNVDDIDELNLPEEVYCKMLNQLNRIQPNDEISEHLEKNGIQYYIETIYYYWSGPKYASLQVRAKNHKQHNIEEWPTGFYIVLDFDNRAGLSREEALKKVDFR